MGKIHPGVASGLMGNKGSSPDKEAAGKEEEKKFKLTCPRGYDPALWAKLSKKE